MKSYIAVEIVEIGTYVHLSGKTDKTWEVTQTETFQVRTAGVSTFRTFVTLVAVDAEGNSLDEDPIKADSSLITEI